MGCIGMSRPDFERCTPSEFRAVYLSWQQREEVRERGAWERARMSCLCSLQPYSKNTLKPTDIMEFPWEKEQSSSISRSITHEDLKERYQNAKKKYGLK